MKSTLFFFCLVFYFGASAQNSAPTFIGLNEAADGSLWLSGTQSILLRRQPGDTLISDFGLVQRESLQFRDVHGFNQDSCLVLAAGEGALSRIYHYSVQSGFRPVYQMPHPKGFLNALALREDGQGFAYGDALDSVPFILQTDDYGASWTRVPARYLPRAGKGEGGFASSGTCITLAPNGTFVIGTGAGGNARLLVKEPHTKHWAVCATPMPTGDFAGITTVQILDSIWFIGGGDLADSTQQNSAFVSVDRGKTWQALAPRPSAGLIYGSALGPVNDGYALVVCGPSGADLSFDLGKTWQNISTQNIWTCLITPKNELWLAGKNGFIKNLHLRELQEKE